MSTLTRVTRREAKEAVDNYLSEYANPVGSTSPEAIDAIVVALTAKQDMQIRDYFMGLSLDQPLDQLIEAVSIFTPFIPEGERAGIYSILATYHYQNLDSVKASQFLALALDEDNDYSLAKLLARVFMAGWTPESFKIMAQELHPKVVEVLDDTIIE